MLYGPDGKMVTRMTWSMFANFQRWNEFPERTDNPPMTVDFAFWYQNKKYYCTGEEFGNVIVDSEWNRLAYNKNFLELLRMPIFLGKSFYDCIEDILFEE